LILLLLAAATLAAHGRSLSWGLFLDDHWHQDQLRKIGWSVGEMLEATTLDTDQLVDTWWRDVPVRWQYSRPVSVLLMKVVHEVSGGSVVAHHAVSLCLHYAVVVMVYQLCLMLTRNRFWSVVGGLFMVIYTHGVFAVGWLAAQNTVLQTALTLGALLMYVRASGLDIGPVEPTSPAPPRLKIGSFALVVVLWLLGFFSRENAVMLPAIMIFFDLAFGGWRHLRARWPVHVVMGVITLALLVWRFGFFYEPMPDVYVQRPDGPGYVLWATAKLLHYLTSSVWMSPMTVGPTGRINPFSESPGDCILMITILSVMGAGYYLACRKARGYWIWPAWILLSVLPVVPLLATPHSGYLCGVGFAVAIVLGPGLFRTIHPVSIGRWCKPVAIAFLVAMCTYIPIYQTLWEGIVAAERYTVAEISLDDPPDGVTDIFFLNLPFANIYAKLSLTELWGGAMSGVRCHVLTFAPDLVAMDEPCVLKQIDDRTFTISVEDARWPYFSGLLGRFLIDGMRSGGPFEEGDVVQTKLFRTRIVRSDRRGVRELEFTFNEPLASDRYRFYLTTEQCGALRMSFAPTSDRQRRLVLSRDKDAFTLRDIDYAGGLLAGGAVSEAYVLLDAMDSDDVAVRGRAWSLFTKVARPIALATASEFQGTVDSADAPPDTAAIREWWRNSVDERLLRRVWLQRAKSDALRRMREGLLTIRRITASIIKTDLYLSGPPFPGPGEVPRK
jgi:hypothetical protein